MKKLLRLYRNWRDYTANSCGTSLNAEWMGKMPVSMPRSLSSGLPVLSMKNCLNIIINRTFRMVFASVNDIL